jgi:hypothetical protein
MGTNGITTLQIEKSRKACIGQRTKEERSMAMHFHKSKKDND